MSFLELIWSSQVVVAFSHKLSFRLSLMTVQELVSPHFFLFFIFFIYFFNLEKQEVIKVASLGLVYCEDNEKANISYNLVKS